MLHIKMQFNRDTVERTHLHVLCSVPVSSSTSLAENKKEHNPVSYRFVPFAERDGYKNVC